MIRLGLRFAGDPRWFYRLSREEQIDVVAIMDADAKEASK